MYRVLSLSTLILTCIILRAQAVEMFTNFDNGQNVGFPPMQVPFCVYGGVTHGGWNPNAEGMPLKTWPPVPAMMPTQQIPGGFRRFNNHAANGHAQNTNSNRAGSQDASSLVNSGSQKNSVASNGQTDDSNSSRNVSSRIGYEPVLVSDRRHNNHWQRGIGSPPENSGNALENSDKLRGEAASNDSSTLKKEPTLAAPPAATILHAVEGKPPVSSEPVPQPEN
ncbi:MAG TPA: hypothetical protein VFE46_05115 [Pirellulales bacterium]|jgi:hypothetical protein|nr:hypothetical protein [Pirellulales bacterium]